MGDRAGGLLGLGERQRAPKPKASVAACCYAGLRPLRASERGERERKQLRWERCIDSVQSCNGEKHNRFRPSVGGLRQVLNEEIAWSCAL